MTSKQTTLDLNGPILSFIQQPQSVSLCSGGTATFIGIATAFFPQQIPPNPALSTGSLSYRWYDQNGPLFDDPPSSGGEGLTISGAATTTLNLYNNTFSRNLYLKVDYIPSAYVLEDQEVNAGTARSTGNAINDPKDSNIVNLLVRPLISITSEPLDFVVSQNNEATFSTTSISNDGTNVEYQWQLNGNDLGDSSTNQNTSVSGTSRITITDDLGSSTTIDFSQISTYSNFVSGRTYTLVSNSNISTKITASGAGGGFSVERNTPGGSGGSSVGNFTFISGKSYKLIVGGAGGTGGTGGFGGGGIGGGGTGKGGGGGGYTGLFDTSISQSNAIIIAGGGGGGSNDPTNGGSGGGTTGTGNGGRSGTGGSQTSGGSAGGSDGSSGTSGTALQGGSGGAGGGGGYFGGGGGQSYNGCCADGAGGGGSGFLHPTLLTSSSMIQGEGSSSGINGLFKIDLISTQIATVITSSGTKTQTLKITSNTPGVNQVRCKISHPTACNSPLFTRSANFTVVDPRQIVNFERFDETNLYSTGSRNLADSSITLTGDSSITFLQYCIYASEEDVRVRITLAGGAGVSRSGFRGGQGGLSVIQYTLKQNVEYILKLGSGAPPTGGANGGGGGAFLYEKARIIAVCGGGGGAGTSARGGDGGGVNVAGESGQGSSSGAGGRSISAGTLPSNTGYDNSGTTGGQVSGCTIGNYYANYYTPCADVGQVQFRNGSGTILSGTATLLRGWKSGAGYRNNGGDGSGNQGGGGAGTYGGNAATANGAGGGGGSGYTDGSITLISTQLGGNSNTNAYAIIEKVG